MNNFPETAAEFFMQGNSCSESVVKAAYETGLIDKSLDFELLNKITSPFSGAMGTHECLCGAVAGSQITLGLLFGRKSPADDPHVIKNIAKEFIIRFKEKRNATCCRALRAKYKDNPAEARKNCAEIVKESAGIIQAMVNEKINAPAS